MQALKMFLVFILRFRFNLHNSEIEEIKKFFLSQRISFFIYLIFLKNILILSKEKFEKIKEIYQYPKIAIDFFRNKVLVQNTLFLRKTKIGRESIKGNIIGGFKEKSIKRNLFPSSIFFAENMNNVMRNGYISLLIKGIDPEKYQGNEIALDITEAKDKILFFAIYFRCEFIYQDSINKDYEISKKIAA